ncbi:MAG: CPBP family intramembrane metalloprotease [Caldilineaceae bacterium]|nr:CPBP family intramembrane metalloprotease [Caldilineaceae bacterium]
MAESAGVIVMFVPLFFIMFIANAAEARRTTDQPYQALALLAYISLAFLYLLGILFGVGLQAAAPTLQRQPELLDLLGLADAGISLDSLGMLGLGLWLPSLVGMVLLLPPVRRAAAAVTRLDPASPVHAVALAMSMLIIINLLVTLGFGLGNLTTMLEAQNSANPDADGALVTLWVQQILMALLAKVGWLTRRSFGEAMARLGITRVSGRQVLLALGLALLMVPVVALIEYLGSLVGFGANADVEALSEELFGPLFQSPFGILTIGLAAALGEEPLFRGAAQPRFGLILTALMFALVHSNYGITISTVVVFVLGLVLGWLRRNHNTTTSMIMHASYNITLAIIAYLSLRFLEF